MKHKTNNSDQIIVRMPSDLHDRIERKASEEGRSLSAMARRILGGLGGLAARGAWLRGMNPVAAGDQDPR
jgi:Arc-like DNA binding domain